MKTPAIIEIKSHSKLSIVLASVLLVSSIVTEQVKAHEEEENGKFCFEQEHLEDVVTPKSAFAIAECFKGEALYLKDSTKMKPNKRLTGTLSNQYVFLQYADSWYAYASGLGHPSAYQALIKLRQGHSYQLKD